MRYYLTSNPEEADSFLPNGIPLGEFSTVTVDQAGHWDEETTILFLHSELLSVPVYAIRWTDIDLFKAGQCIEMVHSIQVAQIKLNNKWQLLDNPANKYEIGFVDSIGIDLSSLDSRYVIFQEETVTWPSNDGKVLILINQMAKEIRRAEFRNKVINEIKEIKAKISKILEINDVAKLVSLETLDDYIKDQLFESLNSRFKHLKN